jgi:hypothetical protein
VKDYGKMAIEKFHSAWSPKITPKMVLAEICEVLQEVLPVSIEENLCHWLQFAPPFKKGSTGHFEEISMQALAFDAARNRHVLWQEAASRIKHGLVKTNMPGGPMGEGEVNFEMAPRTENSSEGNTISAGGAGTLVAIRRRVCPQPCTGGCKQAILSGVVRCCSPFSVFVFASVLEFGIISKLLVRERGGREIVFAPSFLPVDPCWNSQEEARVEWQVGKKHQKRAGTAFNRGMEARSFGS